MKTIGLLGGTSWESTTLYYQKINTLIKERLGAQHSAKIYLYSFDYYEIAHALEQDDWKSVERDLLTHGKILERAGAELCALCANTTHLAAQPLEEALSIPLVHIAKATLDVATSQAMKRVLLLGTRYTMQSRLYQEVFEPAGIEVLTPSRRDQGLIHRIIYQELIQGQFLDSSKQALLDIIAKQPVDGVILGCTELPLILHSSDVCTPLLDTLELHVKAIVDAALNDQ